MATKKALLVTTKHPAAVGSVPGDNSRRILEDTTREEGGDPLPIEVAEKIRASVMEWAVETATVLNDDPDFGQDMKQYWSAIETAKKGAAITAMDLIGTFGIEKLRTFPVFGVKLKDMGKWETLSADDRNRSMEYPTTTVGKDGVTKNSTGNKYKDMVARLDWVIQEQELVAYWEHLIADPASKREPPAFTQMTNAQMKLKYPNKAARGGQLDLHKSRVNSAYTIIGNAMRVIVAMDKIQTKCPLIGCEFRMVQATQLIPVNDDEPEGAQKEQLIYIADDGSLTFETTNTPHKVLTDARKCIVCYSKTTTGADWQGDDYSVGGFLQFNVDEAIKNGGTYEALVATAKREVEPAGTMLPDVKTGKNGNRDEYIGNLARFFAEGNHTDLLLKEIVSGKLPSATIIAIEKIRMELEVITNATEFGVALAKARTGKSTDEWLRKTAA